MIDSKNKKTTAPRSDGQERKWLRQPEERPDAILDSALSCFREKGFAATKMDEIAIGAGLSKGGIYLYFDSKEDMFQALVRRAILPMVQQIELVGSQVKTLGKKQVVDSLRMIAALGAEKLLLEDTAAIPLLVLSEARAFPELASYYQRNVVSKVLAALAAMIAQGQAKGAFTRKLDPALAARSFAGGIFLQLILTQVFTIPNPGKNTMPDSIRHHVDLMLNGMSA